MSGKKRPKDVISLEEYRAKQKHRHIEVDGIPLCELIPNAEEMLEGLILRATVRFIVMHLEFMGQLPYTRILGAVRVAGPVPARKVQEILKILVVNGMARRFKRNGAVWYAWVK